MEKKQKKLLTPDDKVGEKLKQDDQALSAWLHHADFLVLYRLSTLGKKTRYQLLSLGLQPFMIQKLTKYGILESEYDPTTNLTYYKVKDDLFHRD